VGSKNIQPLKESCAGDGAKPFPAQDDEIMGAGKRDAGEHKSKRLI
jgi:hypothetical protein